jgi:lysophospholipase L1-like esterase
MLLKLALPCAFLFVACGGDGTGSDPEGTSGSGSASEGGARSGAPGSRAGAAPGATGGVANAGATSTIGGSLVGMSGSGAAPNGGVSTSGGGRAGGSNTGASDSGGSRSNSGAAGDAQAGRGAGASGSSSGAASSGGRSGTGGTAVGGAGPASGTGGATSNAGSSSGGGNGAPLRIYLAGDSTVSAYTDTASDKDQAGWGQMLGQHFDSRVTIVNRAIGGRTARRFIDEGHLDKIFSEIRAGDYLFVQFGTNDGNKTATYEINGQTVPYYLDPATDFKTYLKRYIDGVRERSATAVLVTPPPRNSAYCTGGNGTGAHAQAMRELAEADGVALSDLNARSVSYLKAICPAPMPEDFFLLRADGNVDGTHFQENGARILAGFVRDGVREAVPALAAYAK